MNLLFPYKLIWRLRMLVVESVFNGLRTRYVGSVLGLAWLVIGPTVLLSLYAVVYLVLFNVRPTDFSRFDYIIYIFSGLIPFISFSQALSAGTASLSKDAGLLLNAVFPAELIPLREVLVSFATMVVGISVVLLMKLFQGEASWAWLLLPVFLLLMAMATTGIVWVLSLGGLLFKDVQEVISYLTIVILITAPIAYTPEMISGLVKYVIMLNPLTYFVVCFQQIIVMGRMPPIEFSLGALFISLFLFHTSFAIFQKAKRAVMDFV